MIQVLASDIEFYKAKIISLEESLEVVHQQLTLTKIKVRTAEDYKYKYQALLNEIKPDKKMVFDLQEQNGQLRKKIKEVEQISKNKQKQLKQHYEGIYSRLSKENSQMSSRYRNSGEEEKLQILEFKYKKCLSEKKSIEEEFQKFKITNEEKRISQIQKIKSELTTKYRQKQQNDKQIYRGKIQQLQQKLSETQQLLNDEKIKTNPNREAEIVRLKQLIISNNIQNNLEINKISQTYHQKLSKMEESYNQKIKLIQYLEEQNSKLIKEQKELHNNFIKQQKQHQIQFLYLKEKLTKIRNDEIQTMKEQMNANSNDFLTERNSWKNLIIQKDQEMENKEKFRQQERSRHKGQKDLLLKKLEQLKERLRQYEGDRQTGKTEQLLQSLKNITEKQNSITNYEDGIRFLKRQLQKAITKIEQKNLQIKDLYKQLNSMREQFNKEQQQNRNKIKLEKKKLTDRIIQLQGIIDKLTNQAKEREVFIKEKQRNHENEILKFQVSKDSMNERYKQLQNDYNRAVEGKKDIEKQYREERDKGIVSRSEIATNNKMKWHQLQRQRNQVQVIFRQKQQQMKNNHQIQLQKIRIDRDNLKQALEIISKQKSILKQQNMRLSGSSKNSSEDKLSEYNKKVASLNLQIALTQNLYDHIIEARANTKRLKTPLQMSSIQSQSEPQDQISSKRRTEEIQAGTPMFPDIYKREDLFNMQFNSFGPKIIKK